MLGLAEYRALAADLAALGRQVEQNTMDSISPDIPRAAAIKIAREAAEEYVEQYQELLERGMLEVGMNAAQYYSGKTGSSIDLDNLVTEVVSSQWEETYYGATLLGRLRVHKRQLQRRIAQSAMLSTEHLGNVYTKTFPYGSQIATDQRLMLSMLVKVEQDVAKEFAKQSDIPLIRWTLSRLHKIPCDCETLASAVNPAVVEYLKEHNLNIDPKGLYFADNYPQSPHPNCQCEHMLVTSRGEQTRGAAQRTFKRVINLLRRLRKK